MTDGILDRILGFLPPGYRRDATFAIIVAGLAWLAFSFNARVAAAETKAAAAASLQTDIVLVETKEAVTDQKVSDIDMNVRALTAALLGAQAVVHHDAPPPPP